MFQYENNVKPDYSNAGGLVIFDDGGWVDWFKDTDEGYWEDLYEYLESVEEIENENSHNRA